MKYQLVKDGEYNEADIIRKAFFYVRRPDMMGNLYWALKEAWTDAELEMQAYKARLHPVEWKPRNNLREFFLTAHPEYRYSDSGWRETV